jgi:hypothetical protein
VIYYRRKTGSPPGHCCAYNYYEEKLTGLGKRFLNALQQRYAALSANPTFYSYIDEDP